MVRTPRTSGWFPHRCLALYRPLSAAWLCLNYWRRGFLAKRAAAAAAGRPLVVLVFVGDAPREAHPELWAEFLGLALSGRPGAREALDLRVCGDGVGPGLDGYAVEVRAGGKVQGSTRERNSQLQRLRSRPFSTRFG